MDLWDENLEAAGATDFWGKFNHHGLYFNPNGFLKTFLRRMNFGFRMYYAKLIFKVCCVIKEKVFIPQSKRTPLFFKYEAVIKET
jgi:hypothetical protein